MSKYSRKKTLKRMKNIYAIGPDNIPVECVKCLRNGERVHLC